MNLLDDTIAAISTPRGSGGIAVIRISGRQAVEIADNLFSGSIRLREAKSHQACYGKLLDIARNSNGESADGGEALLDEAVVTVFRAPRSYTREDVVEISCHGGQYLSQRILELVLSQNCRLAEPGEFTQRAFLNGRFDLARAEAVADIIRAKTELSLRAALSQFQGVFSGRVKQLRQQLIDVCSLLELELDFAEEDVQFADRSDVAVRIADCVRTIESFIDSYKRGKILREGAKLVIVGKPNVGKSSLLNALLREDRAIVTDIPGTTRDVLEEQLSLGGILVRAVDTAGIRETRDIIEREGVSRTKKQISDADIVLFVFDGADELTTHDHDLVNLVLQIRKSDPVKTGFTAVINKIDLQIKIDKRELKSLLPNCPIVPISAKSLDGLPELETTLIGLILGEGSIHIDEPVVTNLRQKEALQRALASLKSGLQSIESNASSEFVAIDLRGAMDSLGEIIGEVTTEDILGNIFSKFCIGK
jgi:tRNA modification GTPase